MRRDRDAEPLAFYRSAPLAPSTGGAVGRSPAPIPLPARTSEPSAFTRDTGAEQETPDRAIGRPSSRSYTRRRGDHSQRIRSTVQITFALITLWVGVQFYLWVRYYETGGRSWRVSRPAGVEAWLPIASLMNLKDFLLTGSIAEVHPAGMFMLIAFLAISCLYRKSFCSWICPIGTISEWLWKGGEATFGRVFALPHWLDVPLRSLKYILFGLFAYVVVAMPVPEIRAFLNSSYGMVADVKMLDFFRLMGEMTAIVLAVLVILSVFVKNFWCRFLCPYGAMTGLVALISHMRIRRDPIACIDCAKCAKACPAGLPVDTALSIRSAECTACMTCVSVCPAAGALDLKTGLRRHAVVPAWALASAIAIVFFGIVGYARLAGHWHTNLPDAVLFDLIPRAGEFAHPR